MALTPVDDTAYPAGIRTFRDSDAAPILAAAIACLDRGEFEGVTAHDLEESLKRLPGDPGMCAVAEVDGEVAGWVIPRHDDLTVDLRFRRRGIGTRLVQAGRIIAGRQGRDVLRLWAPRHLPGPIAFLERNGFRYDSSMWLMLLPPSAPVPPPAFPDDVVVRWFEPGTDDEPYVAMANEAFRDHQSPLEFDLDRTRYVHAQPGFDPSTILLVAPADARDELVGFCRVVAYIDDGQPTGDIGPLGLVPAWRGRGIGRELLRWGVEDLRRRGTERIYLSVEADNDGALRLYERTGFERHVEWPHLTVAAIR